MILKAPHSFINYVHQSREFLNCPNVIFNEHLNATYRQFKNNNEVYHIAVLLHTFGYTKTNALKVANELVQFYSTTTLNEFEKLNVSSYVDGTPQYLINKSNQISEYISNNTQYYKFTNIPSHTPSYRFKKGYKLKVF